MSEDKTPSLQELVASLASEDPVARQKAREKLVSTGGHDVTRALLGKLVDPRQHVRWEAAKALTAIADPIAAPALMHSLEDDDEDVRWVAGEGLIALGKDGLLTALNGLTKRATSLDYCKAAHHVLHDLRERGYADVVAPVLKALESSEPEATAPPAAYEALMAVQTADD